MSIPDKNETIYQVIYNSIIKVINEKTLLEFGFFNYLVYADFKDGNKFICMAFKAPDFNKIFDYVGEEFLKKEYSDYSYESYPTLYKEQYDIVLKANIKKFGTLKNKEEKNTEEKNKLKKELEEYGKITAEKFSTFRIKIYSAVIDKMLRDILSGTPTSLISFRLNNKNVLHLIPLKDRVQLLYGIDFSQDTDISLARIFLQELEEAKRHVKNCIDARVYYEKDMIPNDILKVDQPKKYSNGLVVFDLFTKNYKTIANKLNYFITFREYIQFHIHSIKTFLHIRMNKKGKELENKLNSCKIIPDEYLRALETTNFYANWNKKEENLRVFTEESKKLKV
jgi:hypothetical protein